MNIRAAVADAFVLAGFAAITWGAYQYTPVAGWIAGGSLASLAGVLVALGGSR